MSSRFEFLGNASIGQYIPSGSWLHQRDPRARLITYVVVFIGVIFSFGLQGLTLGLVSVVSVFLVAHLPVKPAWDSIKRALPFLLILAILQILFFARNQDDPVIFTVFGYDVIQPALMSGLMLVYRFIVLIMLLNAVVMSLSTSQITAAQFYLFKPLEKIGFPVNDITMIVQVTLRFLPIVAQIAEKTAKAQAARGADWDQRGFNPVRQARRIIPVIVPLMVNSLKRAEVMALAMESRGFSAADERSSYHQLEFTWRDSLLLMTAVIVSTLMILAGLWL